MADLRLMTYNVHMRRDDQAALTAVVRDADPDILIVQEGPRRFRWRQMCARLARDVGLNYAAGGLPSLGNVILTSMRVRVRETWCIRYPLTPGRHMRGAAFARCTVGGATFVVAGSHLSTDPAERPGQAATLKRALSDVDGPVLLGADINEGSGGSAWRMLAEGLTDTGVARGRDDLFTFSCADPKDRIDAIFVDPRVAVRAYDVLDTPLVRRASDHFPILVDLSI